MSLLDTKEGREALRWWFRIEPFALPRSHELRRLAQQHVHDPTKLAELIASEQQRTGVTFCHSPESVKFLGMANARAVLATLLQLPDGAREQAERAIRGET
jgi:hypothetical protein